VTNRPTRATPGGRAYLDLRKSASATGRPIDELLQLYALEGLVDRLSGSPHADRFVLKGGVLLAAFDARRPTRDVDVAAVDLANNVDDIRALVNEVLAVVCDDGLEFDLDATSAAAIRDDDRRSRPSAPQGADRLAAGRLRPGRVRSGQNHRRHASTTTVPGRLVVSSAHGPTTAATIASTSRSGKPCPLRSGPHGVLARSTESATRSSLSAVGSSNVGHDGEVVHAAHHTAVRRLRVGRVGHGTDLLQNELDRHAEPVQHPTMLIRQPSGQLRRRRQWDDTGNSVRSFTNSATGHRVAADPRRRLRPPARAGGAGRCGRRR